MKTKLQEIIDKYHHLSEEMTKPEVLSDQKKLSSIAKEHSSLENVVQVATEYISVLDQIDEDKEMLDEDDAELVEIAREELHSLEIEKSKLEEELKILLLPKDPNDDKNLILEIRAGTGGDEAALFASDLYRLYTRFAERNNWQYKVMESSPIGIGGYKELIMSINGDGAYGMLKFESGVHRVQRVPKTETSGRVHTSAATVAILPEAEEADVQVVDADLKIDTYRASGAGGQHVNKTESAIRITHIPSGLVVTCQDETSQHKNKAAALKVLRSRLLAAEQEQLAKERAAARKDMVSTGDRSAKIRTYNFPQGRITDHRINFTAYNLDGVMDGELNELIENLILADQQTKLTEVV